MKEDYKKSVKNAITLKQAKQIIDKEKYVRDKCLFLFLFDSGARIEEALNVRIGDLTKSSDHKFYMVHLRGTKTEEADRNISLPLCAKEINKWLREHPTGDKEDYLFPIRYDNSRRIIKGMSKRVLDYQLKPHELRHSSATFYIQKFGAENVGGFYYRFGWKFGSKEANTYIKTHLFGGEVGQKQVIKAVESGKVQELETEMEAMKKMITQQRMTYLADTNKLIPMIRKRILEDLNDGSLSFNKEQQKFIFNDIPSQKEFLEQHTATIKQ